MFEDDPVIVERMVRYFRTHEHSESTSSTIKTQGTQAMGETRFYVLADRYIAVGMKDSAQANLEDCVSERWTLLRIPRAVLQVPSRTLRHDKGPPVTTTSS